MKKALLLLVALVYASTILAEEGQYSEFFQQPSAGSHQVQFDLKYATQEKTYIPKSRTLVLSQKKSENLTRSMVEYGYGLNENYALHFGLVYSVGGQNINTTFGGQDTNTTLNTGSIRQDSVNVSGLEDINLDFLATHAMGSGKLHWGVELDFSMGRIMDTTGSEVLVNAQSGSTTLRPYIGYAMSEGLCAFGGRFSYDIYKSDTSTETKALSGSTSATTKGGESLRIHGFYEHSFTSWLLGGHLEYINQADFMTSANQIYQYSPDAVNIKIYSTFDLAENTTLLANLETRLLKIEDKYRLHVPPREGIESAETTASGFMVGLGLRMMF